MTAMLPQRPRAAPGATTRPLHAAAVAPRHFLDIADHDGATLRDILGLAARLRHTPAPLLPGRTLALIFEQPSTRTRVSFEVAMRSLGGHVTVLSNQDMQLGRGETIGDTARVLSRYVDAIMLRTDRAAKLLELAAHASVPVINGLTEKSHPCQIMADVMTFEDHRGPIGGRVVAWCGDGNNVARSWVHAAARLGFALRVASPPSCRLPADIVAWAVAAGADLTLSDDPAEAVLGAHAVVTDAWHSMADAPDRNMRADLTPYRVTAALMATAAPDAVFMHCLPAHRGEEVEADVIDGPQSIVFDEAENRLHAQRGILAWTMSH